MKRLKHFISPVLIILILTSACQENKNYESKAIPVNEEEYQAGMEEAAETEEVSESEVATEEISITDVVSSSTRKYIIEDKKFIRKANLKFEVDDVYSSTTRIETVATSNGGFVTSGDLSTRVVRTETYPTDQESAIEVSEYETRSYITLRVPDHNLHAALSGIAQEIKFLHQRSLQADDVTLKLVEQELAEKRAQNGKKRLSGKRAKIKSKDLATLENLAYRRETDRDMAILRQFSLEDEVAFSTITIEVIQDNQIQQKVVPNLDAIRAEKEPGFGHRLLNSLSFGADVLKELALLVASIWPFLLIGAVIAFALLRKKFFGKS